MMGCHITTKAASNTNWVLLDEVTGHKGVLRGLAVAGGSYDHYFRITIDNDEIVREFLCGARDSRQNNGIGVNLPFGKSLRIEIRDDDQPDPLARFWAAYTVSGSELVGKPSPEPRKFGDITYTYERSQFKAKDKPYEVTSLIGPERVSRIILDQDCIVASAKEGITGHLELKRYERKSTDTPPFYFYTEVAEEKKPWGSLVIRPIGAKRTFPIKENVTLYNGFEIKHEFSIQGKFDVLAQIQGYVNIPAKLTIL